MQSVHRPKERLITRHYRVCTGKTRIERSIQLLMFDVYNRSRIAAYNTCIHQDPSPHDESLCEFV
jgi:hypothetical protein